MRFRHTGQSRYRPRFDNPYFKKTKNQKKNKRFYFDFSLIIFIFCLWIYILFSSSYFKIIDWELPLAGNDNKNDVINFIQSYLKIKKFFIFENSNIFIFDREDFKKKLSPQFIFKSVKIKKYYPDKIIIELEEYMPKSAVYHNENIYILADDGTIIVKKEGVHQENLVANPLDKIAATTTSDNGLEKIMADTQEKELSDFIFYDAYSENINLNNGSLYPLQNMIKIVTEFAHHLKEQTNISVKITAIYKNQINPKIIVKTNNNWKIYLNSQDSGLKQFNKFSLVLNKIDKNKPLDYIDLRFGDRAYIK